MSKIVCWLATSNCNVTDTSIWWNIALTIKWTIANNSESRQIGNNFREIPCLGNNIFKNNTQWHNTTSDTNYPNEQLVDSALPNIFGKFSYRRPEDTYWTRCQGTSFAYINHTLAIFPSKFTCTSAKHWCRTKDTHKQPHLISRVQTADGKVKWIRW